MTAPSFDWLIHYPAPVSVCDTQGTIIALNRQAAELFAGYGGADLVGTSLFACHPQPASEIIRRLLDEQAGNTYFTEKKGVRRLVHQVPWYDEGRFAGLVETVITLPGDCPTKVRR